MYPILMHIDINNLSGRVPYQDFVGLDNLD